MIKELEIERSFALYFAMIRIPFGHKLRASHTKGVYNTMTNIYANETSILVSNMLKISDLQI